MFWVVTEVCVEHNLKWRMRAIKQFIKVVRQCEAFKNAMFSVISGLGHGSVSRLKQMWEKLPGMYQRLFRDMQDLTDATRGNMSKYCDLINSIEHGQLPMVRFHFEHSLFCRNFSLFFTPFQQIILSPVVNKDSTFIHSGNNTRVDGLINFEKPRMIAKHVRSLSHTCSAPYDLFTILQSSSQFPSATVNQLTTAGGCWAVHHDKHHLSSASVKRRKKSTAMPNSKKMLEEAQMVRRFQAYFSNIKVGNLILNPIVR